MDKQKESEGEKEILESSDTGGQENLEASCLELIAGYLTQMLVVDPAAIMTLQNMLIPCRLELLETAYGMKFGADQSLTSALGIISGICKTHRLEPDYDVQGRLIGIACVEHTDGEFEE